MGGAVEEEARRAQSTIFQIAEQEQTRQIVTKPIGQAPLMRRFLHRVSCGMSVVKRHRQA
ncbi:hypothetical protein PRECH8_22440 [Insulibacter thermoxylanivorax]|uniref:Uncharacterized protein n=1 Tax=Insulibacter thermoxylanivorax TaxID=2749268 RepID=A0A916VGG5_9BACL|nr:hypothetical protein PRECH8_22440 [Insulibacter thermoxylanivorax]